MKDNHKIAIRVTQQMTSNSLNEAKQSEMVTEWHVKRILVAAISLLSTILLVIYFFTTESIEKEMTKNIEIKTVITPVNVRANKNIKNKAEVSSPPINNETLDVRVIRALLSKEITNKEPLRQIKNPVLVSKEKATGIYYFTEIINMKGQTLYHQWMWNNHEVYKRRIKIRGDRWRASTSKLIPYSKPGTWTVRLVNKDGVILNRIEFNVIKKL